MTKISERDGMTLVKFASHRAREKGLRLLKRKPQEYYSFRRSTGKGVYAVTPEEQQLILAAQITGASASYWTDDLLACWDWS